MTKDFHHIDTVCLQCNGVHCNMTGSSEYKNCKRHKLLEILANAKEKITQFNNMTIYHLAKHIIAGIEQGIYKPTEEQANLALRTEDYWKKYYND